MDTNRWNFGATLLYSLKPSGKTVLRKAARSREQRRPGVILGEFLSPAYRTIVQEDLRNIIANEKTNLDGFS